MIPESKFSNYTYITDIYGKFGLLEYIYSELIAKKHLVIVVAEGAGKGVLDLDKLTEGV